MADVRKGAVLWKGNPTDLAGPELKAGDRAPDNFTLTANDMSAVKGLMDPEVSLVVGNEEVVSGFDNVLRKLNDRLKALSGNQSTITGKEIIRIQGDTAIVTYIANTTSQRGIVTCVYRRTKDNKWLILHLHDTWSPPAK